MQSWDGVRRRFHARRPFGLGHGIALVLLLASGAALPEDPQTQGTPPLVRAVESISMPVGDMERSIAFYHDVLHFETVSDREVAGDAYEHLYGLFGLRVRIVTLKLGDEVLKLEKFIAPRGRPMPVDSRGNDRSFQHVAIIVSDMGRAFAWLRENHVEFVSSEPQLLPQWNPAAGGISAFYFRDPDGHFLEILHFPEGKGAPQWHVATDRVFLGIDHSAIVVADTSQSLGYYRDMLGLKIAGTSENYGIEQERLNSVFGARLRITSLRAAHGPGVELLEYLAPRTGRPLPPDTVSNDLWSLHIDMQANVEAADAVLRYSHFAYVSAGPVDVPPGEHHAALLVRDPDGHATLLETPSDTAARGPGGNR